MSKETMKLALEALVAMHAEGKRLGWHVHPKWSTGMDNATNAITALREAMAEQPAQQEPVAYGMWDTMLGKGNRMMMVRLDKGQDGCTVPLYTSPQPAQQEPVAAECNFVGTKEWGRCSIEHHNLVQSEPHNWPGYQTRLLYTSPQPAQQQEPVRIYDYVWPQREEHKDKCIYACSYTPSQHLERGELLAVVHPSQLISTYLQREGETAENPLYTSTPAQQEPVAQWQKRHPHHWEGKWENTNEHDAKWWRDN